MCSCSVKLIILHKICLAKIPFKWCTEEEIHFKSKLWKRWKMCPQAICFQGFQVCAPEACWEEHCFPDRALCQPEEGLRWLLLTGYHISGHKINRETQTQGDRNVELETNWPHSTLPAPCIDSLFWHKNRRLCPRSGSGLLLACLTKVIASCKRLKDLSGRKEQLLILVCTGWEWS